MKIKHACPLALGAALALAACLPTTPAQAGDACLVGTWSPQGNGAAEWVQRQAPGMKMAITHQVATLVLAADGSYRQQSQIQASATGQHATSARSDARFSARGRWSSEAGRLTLTPSESEMDGKVELGSGSGGGTTMALPESPAQTASHEYSCRGGELETRMKIPGIADPIVQRYRRL